MFNISSAVTAFLHSKSYHTYFTKLYKRIERLIVVNCYQKIRAQGPKDCLKVVFGEATQNLDNFVYGNNSTKIARNSFLNPSKLIGKPCGKGSGFKASDLHDYLAANTVAAVDLFPIPLPSELYNDTGLQPILTNIGGLSAEQSNFIDDKVEEIVDLAVSIKATQIKTIARYSKPNVIVMATIFNSRLATALIGKGIILTAVAGDLSNAAGGFDIEKYTNFL